MFRDNAMANRQSQAGALARRLRGKERVEDFAEHIGGHSAAGILEFQFDMIDEFFQSDFEASHGIR